MIAFWIGLPLYLRFVLVAVAGLIGGAVANHLIYRFAYFNPRPISPWGPKPDGAASRSFLDRIPVIGWWRLRRESSIHGTGFWIRPLLIELATAIGLMWLFHVETEAGGLLPAELRTVARLAAFRPALTTVFFCHFVLVVLMVAATFVDFDERTIPDVITIPGTLFGLAVASCTLQVFMPTALPIGRFATEAAPTTFDSPWFATADWMGQRGLAVGLLIWTVWCFALSDRRWSPVIFRRRGFGRAVKHFTNGLFHYGFWKVLAAMWVLGLAGIFGVWNLGGGHWYGLFTSLVGLAVGGGVVWSIRIVATWALNMEAMGFGDVTLMAMIGSMIGWQAALIAFFLSPFAAIVIVLLRYVITKDAYTPFGPYLCAGTLMTIVFWDGLYNGWLAGSLSMMGTMLLWLSVAMLGLLGVMLMIWRRIKMAIFA